jgi:hypothetical protein
LFVKLRQKCTRANLQSDNVVIAMSGPKTTQCSITYTIFLCILYSFLIDHSNFFEISFERKYLLNLIFLKKVVFSLSIFLFGIVL